MIGSIIGAGLKVAGGIFGGIKASKAMKKQRRMLDQAEKDNQVWFEKQYNEDPTQRTSAQQALNQMKQAMRERTSRSTGTNVVAGGTEESIAAEKEAQNNALAGVTGNIIAEGEARKDAIEGQYIQKKDAITNARMDLEAKKAANITNAIQGVANTAAGLSDGLGQVKGNPNPNLGRLDGAPVGKITDMADKGDFGLVNGKIVRNF